jgi:hypothetical protein
LIGRSKRQIGAALKRLRRRAHGAYAVEKVCRDNRGGWWQLRMRP